MPYTASVENLDRLETYYVRASDSLVWPSVFVLPGWLKAWWQVFGGGFKPLVLVFREGDAIIGIAPLKLKDGTASFIGDNSVCDYLDFVVSANREGDFADALLDSLPAYGIKRLNLETLRAESVAFTRVAEVTRQHNLVVSCSQIDASFEMELPSIWNNYLESLETKQRHDIERKMRRLRRIGETRFRILSNTDVTDADLALFFRMMADSRRDKARFLTAEMCVFFERIARAMAAYGLLRLGFLEVGKARAASILYFDYHSRIYLYNSGYDPDFAGSDAGLVSKLYCIQEAVAENKKVFDFLKGSEVYKSRLGGREVGLSRCVIDLG